MASCIRLAPFFLLLLAGLTVPPLLKSWRPQTSEVRALASLAQTIEQQSAIDIEGNGKVAKVRDRQIVKAVARAFRNVRQESRIDLGDGVLGSGPTFLVSASGADDTYHIGISGKRLYFWDRNFKNLRIYTTNSGVDERDLYAAWRKCFAANEGPD